ncbi:MAG: hypothetical protein KJ964_07610 [Verrucomicrobia bacterium]|nr:hypothetical protein [Verrucomicrobiota bacterium]MBU1736254.1 hypothetical protein [Verrucomicrobiota bacterium]MBU1857652.1 hypothetical protein [Verrucomicrobiota bacterium]
MRSKKTSIFSLIRAHAFGVASLRARPAPSGVIRGCFLFTVLVMIATGCSTPPKVVRTDPEIERNVAVARGAYAAGSAEKAAIYYQKALQRARIMDSPAEIARNAYNLAACLAALHKYDAALACLDEARLEFQRAGIPCRELPLLEAKIALAQGRSREATSLARAELKKPAKVSGPNDAIRVQWHLLLAELLCDQDQADDAEAELAAIAPKQLKASGTDIRAETALTRARIQMLKRNPQAAALQYDIAAQYWQEAGRYIDMANALDQAGHAYENAGNNLSATDRYYRAARSLFESGQLARARDLATQALPLAAASLQPALQNQVERLKAEIEAEGQK